MEGLACGRDCGGKEAARLGGVAAAAERRSEARVRRASRQAGRVSLPPVRVCGQVTAGVLSLHSGSAIGKSVCRKPSPLGSQNWSASLSMG